MPNVNKVVHIGSAWGDWATASLIESCITSGLSLVDVSHNPEEAFNHHDAKFGICFGLRPPYEHMVGKLPYPVVVIDSGYFLRPRYNDPYVETDLETTYYSVGINRILDVPVLPPTGRLDYLVRNFPASMPHASWPTNTPDGPILVVGQVGDDRSHGLSHDDLLAYLGERVSALNTQDRPVIYRPHPQSPFHSLPPWADEVNCMKEFRSTLWAFRPSQIITHCSTAGLEALCLTYQVDSHPSAFYHGRERTEVMNSCAESQFNLTELRNGTALNYINQRLASSL